MAGIGHITSRRPVHSHSPDLVRIAINSFRGSNRAASVLFSVTNHHIESIDGKTAGSLSATHNHGSG